MKKVPRCNVQLCNSEGESGEQPHNLGLPPGEKTSYMTTTGNCRESPKAAGQTVNFEEESFGEDLNEKEVEEIGRRRTRSMTAVERRELERDKISTFWLKMENTECYNDIAVYVVEVPVADHKKV